MDPATIAGIMSLISAGSSIFGGLSGKSGAKKAAQQQAKDETILTQDKLFTLRQEQRALKGQTIASAAGSGVKVGQGSPLEIIAEQTRNFMREMTLTAKVGASKAQQIKERGNMVGNSAAYQGFSQGAQSMANAFAMFAKSG